MRRRVEHPGASLRLAALGAALALTLAARPARAGDFTGLAVVLITDIAVSGASAVGGTVAALGSGISLGADDGQPATGWRVASYTFGALNFLLGGVHTLAGANAGAAPILGVGIAQLALGTLDLALALWGTYGRAERPARRVSVAPLLLADSAGQPAYGLGARVVAW